MKRAYVQLLSRERSTSYPRRIGLHNPNRLPNLLRRDPQPRTHTSNSRRRRRDEWVGTEVEVEHERVGAFDEDAFVRCESLVDVGYGVDDVGAEAFCKGLK